MRFVPVAVRMMAPQKPSGGTTFSPEGSLLVWRMQACCAAGTPRVPPLGKLRVDSGVRPRYRQCERCKRLLLHVQRADQEEGCSSDPIGSLPR